MKKHLLHLFSTAFLLVVAAGVSAQMVGTNCYLKGTYLEIGMNNNGSFGACTPQGAIPVGYHPHTGATAGPSGTNLAETYDYGHDGWAVGAPAFMGDYTYPGSPFEGWEIQVGAGRARGFQICTGTTAGTAGYTLAGSLSGYSAAGGVAQGTWTGTFTSAAGNLSIRQVTEVGDFSSWVIVTTVMINTGATATGPVYYLRSCDPDNAQTWPPAGFQTTNTIVHQNEDVRHRVLVSARSNAWAGDISYMGLGTRDCRARCFSYSSWPININTDLAPIWAGGAGGVGAISLLGQSHNNLDYGYGLVYNIGSIAPGDSALVSYAYIFNGNMGIDSAFPDPQIVVNNVPLTSYAPPTPNFDTFDACMYPGLLSIPVDILHGSTGGWSWSNWTWSPALGLATTTGVTNTITFAGLPPSITYTITGTDSGTGMNSCHNKTFYLTILTCNDAVANTPCVGDTLMLNAPGDSTGATYVWYGPTMSVVGSTQSVNIFPALYSHNGTFTVIKTVAGVPDTSTIDVTVNALPVVAASSDQPLCGLIVDPLHLSCATDSVCTSWTWSGPLTFTSTDQNPTISPFDSSMQGIYTVTVVSTDGCIGTGNTLVKPGPLADFSFTPIPGCPKDSVALVNLSVDAFVFEWNYGDGSKSFERNPPVHVYNAIPSGTKDYTIILTVTSANGCVDTKTLVVPMTHTVIANFDFVDDTICNTPATAAVINDLSSALRFGLPVSPLVSHEWVFQEPGGHTDNTNGSPDPFIFPEEGYYPVTLTVMDSVGCTDQITKGIYVLQPYIRAIVDSTFCLTSAMQILVTTHTDNVADDYGYTYAWTPSTDLNTDTSMRPFFSGIGTYVYSITATLNHEGCTGSHVMTLHSKQPTPILNVTDDTKINFGESIQLNAGNTLHYYWAPNDGSLSNPNINNPIATPTVTTTYTITGMDFYGCKDVKYVTIVVDSSQNEFIPTAFTPNGDGLNDVFRLRGSAFHKLVEFRVYNRWGQQVFYSTNIERGWDGTFGGQPAPMGVYHYSVITARPGHDHNQVIKGDVTLIR